ncbi:MAG: 4Fe-4S dicluster domain-containing protein [Ruminococcus sp.]|nr:4Fe-4S dicluster domain-containing protein [Ruminococcus sp.]
MLIDKEKLQSTNQKPSADNKSNGAVRVYEEKENCCGCSACYAICSVGAISMLPDEEGFLYPTVDEEKCVRCYRCLSVCAFKENQRAKGYLAGAQND